MTGKRTFVSYTMSFVRPVSITLILHMTVAARELSNCITLPFNGFLLMVVQFEQWLRRLRSVTVSLYVREAYIEVFFIC